MRLLFDLDGTLTNSYLGISKCIVHALDSLGYEPPADDIHWCVGPPLWESFSILMKTDDRALIDTAVEKYRERFSRVGLFENELYPGIEAMLTTLQNAGHAMSVATSKPTIYAEQIIEHFELAAFFSSVDGAKLNDENANKTSLISGIIARDGLKKNETIMIGDRKYDMIGACENGVEGIGVLWGFGEKEELESANASALVESPADLAFKLTS